MSSELNIILSELDSKKNQDQTYSGIERALTEACKDNTDPKVLAEKIAFSLFETDGNNKHGWGTLYAPQFAMCSEDGNEIIEWPNRAQITSDVLKYWIERSKVTINPYMKARYMSVIYDFYENTMDSKLDFQIKREYIESLLDCCDSKIGHCKELKANCCNAYQIAKQLNQSKLKARAIKTAIDLEKYFSNNQSKDIDGFSFKLFVLSKEQKIESDDFEWILQNFQNKFNFIKLNSDPLYTKVIGMDLISYYRSKGDTQNINKIVAEIASALKIKADSAHPTVASSLYHELHTLYTEFDQHDKAASITVDIHRVGLELLKYMIPMKCTVEFPTEEHEQRVKVLTTGTFEQALVRVLSENIPSRALTIDQLRKRPQAGFLSSMFLNNCIILDESGVPNSRLQTIEEDLEGNIIKNISELLNYTAIELNDCFDRIFSKHSVTTDVLIDYIYQSEIFDALKKDTIHKAIKFYLDNEHEIYAHLIIPQIESVFRKLLELIDVPVYKANNHGGFHLRTLDDLIRAPAIKGLFHEDGVTYFRVVLSEPRGWNLRNKVCHGLMKSNQFNQTTSVLLMHVLLTLSQVRIRDKEK